VPTGAAARFCGRCGAARPSPRAVAGRPTGAVLAGGTVLALGLATGVVAIGALDAPALLEGTGSTDAVTELVPPDEDPPAAPRLEDVDPDAAQDLRAAVDPDRSRCEPQGCERWFRALRADARAPWVAVADDRVSLVDGGEVVVLDLATGADQLRVALDDVLGATPPAATGETVRSWPLEDGVAVLSDQAIAVADRDGSRRWHLDAGGRPAYADVHGDHLHVNLHDDDGRRHVRSYALDDGRLALARQDASMLAAEPLVLLESDAARTIVTRLAGDDLRELWRAELPDPRGADYGQVVGGVLVLDRTSLGLPPDAGDTQEEDGGAAAETADGAADASDAGGDTVGPDADTTPEVAMLDPRDGRILARFPGALAGVQEVDGLAVALLASPATHRRMLTSSSAPDDEPFRYRLVAVGPDGLHLDVEVEADGSRATFPRSRLWRDDAGVVLALGDEQPQRIDLDEGRLVAAPGIAVDDDQRLQLDARTTVIWPNDPLESSGFALERAGRRTELSGSTGWPLAAGDDVLVVGDGSLLLVDPSAGRPGAS
jgi:hypothetical protein